jgi:hypothetical protein
MLNPKAGQQSLSLLATSRSVEQNRAFNSPEAPRFKPEVLTKLAEEFSITTIEDLYGWAKVSDPMRVRTSLGEGILKTDRLTLAESLEPFIAPEMLRLFALMSRFEYSFGAHLGATSPPAVSSSDEFREIGPPWFSREVSLIDDYMPPIRNQGPRSTSVAFATCAVMEYAFARERDQRLDLSEQWHYWNCKRCDGHAKSEGTSLRWSFYLAARDGVCEEQHWPYNVLDDPSKPEPNPPPSLAVNAMKHRITRFTEVPTPKNVGVLKRLLGRGQAIAFAIPMFASIEENVNTRLTGNILMPAETEAPLPLGHAMVLVGYGDHPDFAIAGERHVRSAWVTVRSRTVFWNVTINAHWRWHCDSVWMRCDELGNPAVQGGVHYTSMLFSLSSRDVAQWRRSESQS